MYAEEEGLFLHFPHPVQEVGVDECFWFNLSPLVAGGVWFPEEEKLVEIQENPPSVSSLE